MDENSADTPEPDNNDSEPLGGFSPFDELMKDDALTEESLQSVINNYAEAYRQEYELKLQADPDPTNVAEYTSDFFRKNVHAAAAQIVWLANNAESESVRGNMSKYIVDVATKESDAAGDPIKDLLTKLTVQSQPITSGNEAPKGNDG